MAHMLLSLPLRRRSWLILCRLSFLQLGQEQRRQVPRRWSSHAKVAEAAGERSLPLLAAAKLHLILCNMFPDLELSVLSWGYPQFSSRFGRIFHYQYLYINYKPSSDNGVPKFIETPRSLEESSESSSTICSEFRQTVQGAVRRLADDLYSGEARESQKRGQDIGIYWMCPWMGIP